MTKEYILNEYKDINFMYNNPNKYDDLSKMLDELIEDAIYCFITKLHSDYAIDIINDMKGKINDI